MPSFDSAPSHRFRTLLLAVVLAALAAVSYAWLRGGAPSITAVELPSAIGAHKLVTFAVQAPVGVASVEAHMLQGGKTIPLGQQTFAAARWFTAGASPQVVHFSVQAGRGDHPELSDGPATLVVTARAANLRGASATFQRELAIRSTPPSVYAMSTQIYVAQGGSSLVVYHVSSGSDQSGVEMDNLFFPGYPLPNAAPGGAGKTMFCLFAFPYNAPADSQPELVARDEAGNQATASLSAKTFPKTFRARTLPIDDNFIERVVMPIIANTPSISDQHDPVKNFLLVNRDLRRTNTQELIDAAKLSVQQFLWKGAFTQLSNSAVEAEFADHRSYQYHGRIIDQEDHLGYDLAAVRHTPVKAANAGRVIWAKYFGIYGNCVLIDHGYGLMSLYAHLNDFAVKAGDLVAQGQLIAHSDSTGLAGGDHLHFSMLLDGVQVNPMEWWDPHWVHDRIQTKLDQFSATAVTPTPSAGQN
ncbi:MAG TPA: M23 family metallopeptidase [Terriglobales bacterium]|nr:M23 family metallopeptidase [Terriglobales bacterium]